MSFIASLKQRVVDAEEEVSRLDAENMLLRSKLDSFFSGDIPQGATLDHMVLAKYGRQRLLEKRQTAALLAK